MTTLALTGTTGQLGRLVLDRLPGRVDRLIVRDAARAPQVDGADVRVASYDDREASVAALRGVDVLFMVSGAEAPDRREQHRTFIAAAAEAGVGHVVYTSFLGAAADAGFTLGRDHHDAEQAVRGSGMAWTLLRNNFYTEVLPLFADEDGVIAGPAGQGRLASVAREDVADVAAAVLADAAAHAGATYALTGPEALTLSEATARMTQLLGRDYSYREETLDEAYASRRRWSQEQYQLDAWVSTYTAIADGECATVTDDVAQVAGHPARTLEDALG